MGWILPFVSIAPQLSPWRAHSNWWKQINNYWYQNSELSATFHRQPNQTQLPNWTNGLKLINYKWLISPSQNNSHLDDQAVTKTSPEFELNIYALWSVRQGGCYCQIFFRNNCCLLVAESPWKQVPENTAEFGVKWRLLVEEPPTLFPFIFLPVSDKIPPSHTLKLFISLRGKLKSNGNWGPKHCSLPKIKSTLLAGYQMKASNIF